MIYMAGKVEDKLQEQTATTAFQLIWGTLKGLGNLVVDENAVQRAMKEYAQRFLARYGTIKVLHMDQHISLSDAYVAAQVLSPRAMKSFSSIDELHEMFIRQGRHQLSFGGNGEERRDCLDLANEVQYLNVLGAPGAGKSTFLRQLGLEALRPRRNWNDSTLSAMGLKARLDDKQRSRYEHDCLPVLIELRHFRASEIDLVQLIQKELATCGLPESDKLVTAFLETGRLLLLLDGVDEIPGDKLAQAITHVRDFVDRYSTNRFVISCRTAFYKSYFSRFRDVLLADFNDQQISNFINNWFKSDQERRPGIDMELLKLLNEPGNQSVKELASTPLLLTFLCFTYDDRQRLPLNRSELYRQALEILMDRWAASKLVHNEPVYREFHARLEVQMLAEIAAPAFRDNRYFFTRDELVGRITGFLCNELSAPKHLNGDQVLNAIEVQQGLVVQRAQDAWSFSHLTLQEYLTAVWYKGTQEFDELVSKHLFNERWREVFILLAGAMDKADDLLKRMLRVSEKRLTEAPRAFQLIRWASSKAIPVMDAQQTAARRVFALYLARENSLSHYRTGTELALGLFRLESALDGELYDAFAGLYIDLRDQGANLEMGRALIKFGRLRPGIIVRTLRRYVKCVLSLISNVESSQTLSGSWRHVIVYLQAACARLDDVQSNEHAYAEVERIQNIFIDALQVAPELLDIKAEEEKTLNEYVYGCQLIVDCKNAATRISRSTWDDVCQRIFNPPGGSSMDDAKKGRRRKARHA
jgi:hypothetical protein